MIRLAVVQILALSLLSGVASAQWLNVRVPGTPRTADGNPNLTAPTPRTAEGKPDLSGVWAAIRDRPPGSVGSQTTTNRHASNIAADLPEGPPMTSWAKAIRDARQKAQGRGIPTERCLPSGIPPDMLRPDLPFKIIQDPAVTVVLLEEFNNWRQIFTDGRRLPESPQPAWFGYSIGTWEGDTFIVVSIGFNDQTWLDHGGTPHSEALKLTERFRRIDFGHLEIQYTFDDSKAFTNAWSATVEFLLQADTDLLDHQCENERYTSRK